VLVLDRVNGVAYVALSERADRGLAEAWVSSLGYKELVTFSSADGRGKPVYHTNVMMAIGTDVAVVCADSVANAKERQHLLVRGCWLCVCGGGVTAGNCSFSLHCSATATQLFACNN
jgi:hypothetical protein